MMTVQIHCPCCKREAKVPTPIRDDVNVRMCLFCSGLYHIWWIDKGENIVGLKNTGKYMSENESNRFQSEKASFAKGGFTTADREQEKTEYFKFP